MDDTLAELVDRVVADGTFNRLDVQCLASETAWPRGGVEEANALSELLVAACRQYNLRDAPILLPIAATHRRVHQRARVRRKGQPRLEPSLERQGDLADFFSRANRSERGTDEVFSNVTQCAAGLRFEEVICNAVNRGLLGDFFQRSEWSQTSAYDLDLRTAEGKSLEGGLKWACCTHGENQRSYLNIFHLVHEASDMKIFGFYYPGDGDEPNRLDVFLIDDNRRGFDEAAGARGRAMAWVHFGDRRDARRTFTETAVALDGLSSRRSHSRRRPTELRCAPRVGGGSLGTMAV
mmetsp:Transcript_16545/g.53883  ORF Transcript_16545/g.53883 Transcript_16545/m.53883 type:complete len:293 (+) Transcript_16545:1151-2029(+)